MTFHPLNICGDLTAKETTLGDPAGLISSLRTVCGFPISYNNISFLSNNTRPSAEPLYE